MKRLILLAAAILAFVPGVSAHAGLYHTYKGTPVSILIIILWATLAVYEEFGDTWRGRWALYSGVFLAFYAPMAYPHEVIDPTGIGVAVVGVLGIGAATYLRHRTGDGAEHADRQSS